MVIYTITYILLINLIQHSMKRQNYKGNTTMSVSSLPFSIQSDRQFSTVSGL